MHVEISAMLMICFSGRGRRLLSLILHTYIWTSNSRGRRDMVAEILCVLYLSYFILWDERRLGTLKASLCCMYVYIPTWCVFVVPPHLNFFLLHPTHHITSIFNEWPGSYSLFTVANCDDGVLFQNPFCHFKSFKWLRFQSS